MGRFVNQEYGFIYKHSILQHTFCAILILSLLGSWILVRRNVLLFIKVSPCITVTYLVKGVCLFALNNSDIIPCNMLFFLCLYMICYYHYRYFKTQWSLLLVDVIRIIQIACKLSNWAIDTTTVYSAVDIHVNKLSITRLHFLMSRGSPIFANESASSAQSGLILLMD